MNKILITGANGLLGQKLVFLLSKQKDAEIIATGRGAARIDFSDVRYIDLDLVERDKVINAILKETPTHIIHAAAMTQVDLCETEKNTCWENNVIASQNLIEAAAEVGAYFQYISTDFIFDGTGGPYKEGDKPTPINYYGKSKLEAEHLLANSGLTFSIVRTVLVYGLGQDLSRSNIVLWVKKKLENGEKIRVVNDQWRSPTLVEDLAIACKLILEDNKVGIFHISGDEYLTPYDIAIKTADIFGLDKNLISTTNATEFKEVARRPLKTGFNNSKAKSTLGFKPTSLEQGIALIKEQLIN